MSSKKGENDKATPEYTLEQEQDLMTNLDPELQNAILDYRSSDPLRSTNVKREGDKAWVSVIAELCDEEGEIPPELYVSQRIGPIITGRVEIERIEAVRSHKNIRSLKGTRRLRETLGRSVREIRATPQQLRDELPAGFGPVNGSDVIVGIIDHGCDFAHPNFRKPDGTTRILFLWDQHEGTVGQPPVGFTEGREFNADDINNALRAVAPQTPHQRLDYTLRSEHGTHVMDIAAGSGSAFNVRGVAPTADIIFVDLFSQSFEDHESIGDSDFLLHAIKYIFNKAGQRPVVINVSLNFDGGPHDGTSPVEKGIEVFLQEPGRAVVIAAGNSRLENIHLNRLIQNNADTTLRWNIPAGDRSENKVEIWYNGAQQLSVFLISPINNETIGPFPLGTTIRIRRQGSTAARISHRQKDSGNNDNHVVLRFSRLMEPGRWRIVLRSLSSGPIDIHAWIETDEVNRSNFEDSTPTDRKFTIGSIACGPSTIAVSSYNSDHPSDIPGDTAEGPTRDRRFKPEISAPGVAIRSARALTNTVNDITGTSAAAPHVTGVVALLMQSAGRLLTTQEIRNALIRSVRRNPPPVAGCESCLGAGRVDAVEAVRTQVPVPDNELAVMEDFIL